MDGNPALQTAIGKAEKLATEWKFHPKPNEYVGGWDMSSIDEVASRMHLLRDMNELDLIETVALLASCVKLPVIDYTESTKEVIAAKARAGEIIQSLWEIGQIAHVAGLANATRLSIDTSDGRYRDLLRETNEKIDTATSRIGDLENIIKNSSQSGISINLGPVAVDLNVLKQQLNVASKIVQSKSKIDAEFLEQILSSAQRTSESVVGFFKDATTKIGRKAREISAYIAMATTEAWRSGLKLVRQLADERLSNLRETFDRLRPSQLVDVRASQDDLFYLIKTEMDRRVKSDYLSEVQLLSIISERHPNGSYMASLALAVKKADSRREWGSRITYCRFLLNEKQVQEFCSSNFKNDVQMHISQIYGV